MRAPRSFEEAELAVRDAGLEYPETTEDFPWGHRALKVRGKVFAILAVEKGAFSISVKLPVTHPVALTMPFAAPTGYGLGRSGWVTATFGAAGEVPVPLLLDWLGESWRAVAPRKLVAGLEPRPPAEIEVRASRRAATPTSRSARTSPRSSSRSRRSPTGSRSRSR